MGRNMGIEPMHIGATIRRVNHFTRAAKFSKTTLNKKSKVVFRFKTGEYLRFQAVASSVLSAYECLTAVFGKGTGGTTQLSSPEITVIRFSENCTGIHKKQLE